MTVDTLGGCCVEAVEFAEGTVVKFTVCLEKRYDVKSVNEIRK